MCGLRDMRFEAIETLTKKILDEYNRNPVGWKVLADLKGNVIILGPKGCYQLRLVPINPMEYMGVGTKMPNSEGLSSITEASPPYGFRPLSIKATKKLLTATRQYNSILTGKLIRKFLGIRPVSIETIMQEKPGSILSGPVITLSSLNLISEKQRKLEFKLAKEADKLFRKRYPYRASIYG